MMEFFRQWLVGITGATMIIAVAENLMPSGSVKQVGKLTCGLVLLLMVMRPLASLNLDGLEQFQLSWNDWVETHEHDMEIYYNDQMKSIIEAELTSYIEDKAMENGIWCQAVVECDWDEEGILIPKRVEISHLDLDHRRFFLDMILTDLGLNSIHFKEVEDEIMENPPHI